MEVTMKNQENSNKNIAYKKAEKRVKDIKTYYYLLIGFLIIGGPIVYRNYNGNMLNLVKSHQVWMVFTWALFLVGYGIYLFVPYFHQWEERKTNELMNKHLKNK